MVTHVNQLQVLTESETVHLQKLDLFCQLEQTWCLYAK